MVTHKCNKEREISSILVDSGKMAVKIENIQRDVTDIKIDLKSFIKTADIKYATKEEFNTLKVENKRQDKDINWNKEKYIKLAEKISLLAAIAAIGGKTYGLW